MSVVETRNEIKDSKAAIEKVEEEIKKVEAKIEKVEKKIENEKDAEEKKALRDEKKALRDEKKQLFEKEKLLREEKILLLQQQHLDRSNPMIVVAPRKEVPEKERPPKKRPYESYQHIDSAKNYAESAWKKRQLQPSTTIMHGRPPGKTHLPVYIMHKVFDVMKDIIDNGSEATDSDYKLQDNLLELMGRPFTIEDRRRDGINNVLNQSLFYGKINDSIQVVSIASGTTDGTSFDAGVTIEYKNEKGLGGCDPYLQNSAYYVHYWSNKGVPEDDKLDGPSKHCCPWILVEILGQNMGLSAAVFADNWPCIQPLSLHVPFLSTPMDASLGESQLRLCTALRVGTEMLYDFYTKSCNTEDDLQAQFPYKRSFKDANDNDVEFIYTECIKATTNAAVFKAKIKEGGRDIIVKFTQSYGEAVHRLLEGMDMAPNLLSTIVQEHTFKMIVMEAEQDFHHWDENDGKDDVKKERLKQISDAISKAEYVHGDLRAPNILVCEDGKIKVIDFDWAGKAGQVRYPVALNEDAGWHPEVSVNKPITSEHDSHMIGKLLGSF